MIRFLTVSFAVLLLCSPVFGTPTIVVGNHTIQPNMAGQKIDIMVTGGDSVSGVNFNAEVGPGGPPIQDVVLFDNDGPRDYIFDNNNNGASDLDDPHPDKVPLWEGRSTTTTSGTVDVDGLLGTITLDTTSFDTGTWTLKLSDTLNGPTDFAGISASITDGYLSIQGSVIPDNGVPEPSTIVLFLLGVFAMLGYRLQRRR